MSAETDSKNHQAETRLLKDILEYLADGVIVSNIEGRFLLFNSAAERMLGLGAQNVSPDQWTSAYGCYLYDTVTPYPPDRLPLARALKGEEIPDEPIYIKGPHKPSGTWISVSGRPLRHPDGTVWGGFVIFRDISQQMQAERLSHSVSQQLSAVIDNERTAILVENEHREIQSVNRAFCDLFNIPVLPHEVVGADCSKSAERAKHLFRDSEIFVQRVNLLLKRRVAVTNEKLQLADGRLFERDYIPLFDDDTYVGSVWQYRDITPREDVLQKVRIIERLSNALAQTADSVVITDMFGVIEYVNDAFEKTTGYLREDALGSTPRILKSGKHDTGFYRNLWETVKAGEPFRGTIINKKKTGELYTAEQTITPMKDGGGNITHFVSVLRDITDLLHKQEQEIEMRVAREVQQSFYRATASPPGLDVSGSSCPCSEIGGDYYDIISMPDNRLCIAIGDVAGHGIASALTMAEMRAAVRSFATVSGDAGEIITLVNGVLREDLKEGRFATLLLIMVECGDGTFSYASAGHEFCYLLSESGHIDHVLESTGMPLGDFCDEKFVTSESIKLSRGQTLLLMTDGITESWDCNEGPSGTDRAIEYVILHRDCSATDISEGLCLVSKLSSANNEIQDDITSVIMKVL